MTSSELVYPELKGSYQRFGELGEGAFGKVYLAERVVKEEQKEVEDNQNANKSNLINQKDKEESSKSAKQDQLCKYFAIKKLKPYIRKKANSNTIVKIENYPQLLVMKGLHHPNVMDIREIIQENKGYETVYYLVLDLGLPLMDIARHKEIVLSYEQLRCITAQIVDGLAHVHSEGFMHRDVKPSNIYLMRNGTVRLGDYSISRAIKSEQEESVGAGSEQKTGNVTTRYYRAPEIIYGSRHYDQSIDIWGLGCTIAELVLHQTLFPGSSDINQLQLVFSVLGYPEHWPEAEEYPYYLQFDNSQPPKGLKDLLPSSPPELIDFISQCLTLNPSKRPSITTLKAHPLLNSTSQQAQKQLSKICQYLHQKNLKNHFIKLK